MVSASESYSPDTLDSILRANAQPLTSDLDEWLDLAARRNAWWDSCRIKSWLHEKGYALYHRTQSEWGPTTGMFPLSVEPRDNPFPFAYFCEKSSGEDVFRADTGARRTVAFAQNADGQHFALKMILDGSEELRILKHLQQQRQPMSIENFHNVMPIIEVIACEVHWLAVMPRWGEFLPHFSSIREVFYFIHCLLKGLTYLHEHRIAHGDIKKSNIGVNHVKMRELDFVIADRRSLRCQGLLTYALFDFDGSRMFAPSTPLEECRLPYYVSFDTHIWQTTADTLHGELDYNPFAFDVGMLGVLFCIEFQHLTPLAPMLAPLLDKMTTRDIPQRFTALEALKFFEEEVHPQTSDRELNLSLPERATPTPELYDCYDRWKGLDPVFVERWTAFREPPVPRWLRVLRYMCEYHCVFYTIVSMRRIARYIRRMTFG